MEMRGVSIQTFFVGLLANMLEGVGDLFADGL
jgi:hypothetical protein